MTFCWIRNLEKFRIICFVSLSVSKNIDDLFTIAFWWSINSAMGKKQVRKHHFFPTTTEFVCFFFTFFSWNDLCFFFGLCLCLLLQFTDAWQWVRMVARVVVLWGRNSYESILFPPYDWINPCCFFFTFFLEWFMFFFGICFCLLLQFPDAWQWVRMVARVVVQAIYNWW